MEINVGDKVERLYNTLMVVPMGAIGTIVDITSNRVYIKWYDYGTEDYLYETCDEIFKVVESVSKNQKFLETKTVIKRVIDNRLSNRAYISVDPDIDNTVDIVVGAKWQDADGCNFNKRALGELIEILVGIRDTLDD